MHTTAETICTLFMALQCDVHGQMLLCFTFFTYARNISMILCDQRGNVLKICKSSTYRYVEVCLQGPWGLGCKTCDGVTIQAWQCIDFHFHLLHFTHAKLPLKTYATKQRHHLGAHLMWNKKTLFNLVVTSGRLGDGFGKTSDLHNEHNKLLQICGLIREGCSRSDNVWVLLKDSTKTHLSGESSLLRNNTSAYISSGPAWYNLVP